MCLTTWSDLREEIVQCIAKKFTIYADYIRFRSVCRKWGRFVPKYPLHLPTQHPWLMLSNHSFFDLLTGKFHQLNVAPYFTYRTLVCGSGYGWIIIVNRNSEIRLLNPVTLATISLPNIPVTIRVDYDNQKPICLVKIVLSSSPSLADDFTAFAMLHYNKFAFFRKGSQSWIVVDWDIPPRNWVDVIHRSGSFFLVDVNGMISSFDAGLCQTSHLQMAKINFANDRRHLVLFKEDMLLVIQNRLRQPTFEADCFNIIQNRLRQQPTFETDGFNIYKMNWIMQEWEQIHSLGEHSVFIGTKSSLSCAAASVGCLPNSIYFTDYHYGRDVGIYSLSNGHIQRLPDYGYGHSVWVEPTP